MDGGLIIELERTRSLVTVRPQGVLNAYTAPDLRSALLEALAEQTAPVLLDVSGLSIGDDVGLSVLATVGQENERWPGVGLVVGCASAEFMASAEKMGVPASVPIRSNLDAARAELDRSPRPVARRERIEPDRNAPAAARAAVHEFCLDHGVDSSTEAAQLVASELVTNAVVHAGTPIELTLRLAPPLLHIAVRDAGDGQPRITGTVDESAESGRGLVLVDALASSWGTFVPAVGKIVWATLRVRSATRSL